MSADSADERYQAAERERKMLIQFTRTGRVATTAIACLIFGFVASAYAKKPSRPPPPEPPTPPACDAVQPDYAIFLDDYPDGRFHLAVLPCLSGDDVNIVTPRKLALDLPRKAQRAFQVANGDIYNDGNEIRIVFGGRTNSRDYWDIYQGVIDLDRELITNISVLISTPFTREEDPRFSTDGQWIVYKSKGEIWRVYARDTLALPELFHKEKGCELWAPSMYANAVTYTQRCGEEPDRIAYQLDGGPPVILASSGGGPDRFPHFTPNGDVIYSHFDINTNTSSLWTYTPGADPEILHDETISDDDPYADRNGNEYIAFAGWGDDRYDLYVYRRSLGSAAKVTDGMNVLGPVLVE